ncbi:MAG: SRPBCC family protein, partial [Flavobacteriales bacterium]
TSNTADRLSGHAIAIDAPLVARRSIHIAATPEKVWAVLTDPAAWPRWNADIAQVRVHEDVLVGREFVWRTGGATIRSTLHTVEPLRAFGWTGRTFGLFAIHNWNIVPTAEGVRVDVAESMDGWLARWFRASFQKNLEKGMERWLQALERACTT